MNTHRHGTTVLGAPGSIARELSETRDLVRALANRLHICSRLLTAAAERLGWDSPTVQKLMEELRASTTKEER